MNTKIIKTILTLLLLVFLINPLKAQEDSGQPGSFLNYGIGARALGMGRSFTSIADDASGVFWNPAGIIGAERIEMTSFYTNLYYDSRFSHIGAVFPRPLKNSKNKIIDFLFGQSSSIGFGWIGLASTGYDQRNSYGVHLGDFGFNENAFLTAWAREEITKWGILQYGINFKLVNQNINGLQATAAADYESKIQKWSAGTDFGLIFQPIHAPLLNIVSLKYLIPFKFGFVIQNAVQPEWRKNEAFPVIFRYGFSYRFIMKDWIPITWSVLHEFFSDSYILTSFDREFYKDKQTGNYFGMEGYFPLFNKNYILYPRFGCSNRTEKFTLGFGLSMPFAKSTSIRADYAYCYHPTFSADSRFFLTFKMGDIFNAGHFSDKAEQTGEKDMLKAISLYPHNCISSVVERLVKIETDSMRIRRYYELVGGIGRANLLIDDARMYLRENKNKKAKKAAREAVKEYMPIYDQKSSVLEDEQLLDYAEALIICNQSNEAINVLEIVRDSSLKMLYFTGVCKRDKEDWNGAIKVLSKAVKKYKGIDKKSMISLSLLALGESLMHNNQYNSAMRFFDNDLLKNVNQQLNFDYPRYPIIKDDYLADDIQFLKGICKIKMGDVKEDIKEAISLLFETHRFYSYYKISEIIEDKSEEIISNLYQENIPELKRIADELLDKYRKSYRLIY